jgi:hypothetical protein
MIPVFALSNLFRWWIAKNVMHRLVDDVQQLCGRYMTDAHQHRNTSLTTR